MKSRRNYYRLLRVQPDASPDIIKLCYRTLMQTLQHHPDLGGEEWNAQNINMAYAILRNPTKRAAYDHKLFQRTSIKTVSRGNLGKTTSTGGASRLKNGTRRNFYRILQVQPDAEPEIIRAVYKLLKRDGKANHDLLDNAWKTLNNKARRQQYDNNLKRSTNSQKTHSKTHHTKQQEEKVSANTQRQHSQQGNSSQSKREENKNNQTHYKQGASTSQETKQHYCGPSCVFCKTPYINNSYAQKQDYCFQCNSPLQAISSDYAKLPRRSVDRKKSQIPAAIYDSWPSKPTRVSATDISPTGFGFVSKTPLGSGQLIKIDTEQFRAVAEIRYCKPIGPFFKTGARFISIKFHQQQGTFFSRIA